MLVYKSLHSYAYMGGRALVDLMEEIRSILRKEKELSVRQISIRTGSQWRTVEKALKSMKSLGAVKERNDKNDMRKARLFSLVKK